MAHTFEELFSKLSAIEEGQKKIHNLLTNNPSTTQSNPLGPDAPVLSSEQVKTMTGWPNGTFYFKVSQMPEGVVIRGRSKRLLFDREKLMVWLKSPVQQ